MHRVPSSKDASPTGNTRRRSHRGRAALGAALALLMLTALSAPAASAAPAKGPTASFEYSPDAPVLHQTVAFTSTAEAGADPISFQAWDLDGDGHYDVTGATATATFDTAGPHTVRLLVLDRRWRVSVATRTVTVYLPPTASFDFAPATPGPDQAITFTSSAQAGDAASRITSEAWDLDGDGGFDDATGPSAVAPFRAPGTYSVGLRVVDNHGNAATARRSVTVSRPPTAAFDASPPDPVAGAPVTFTSRASDPDGKVVAQAWDLDGDGAFDDGNDATASATFAEGVHVVRLRVTDSQGISAVAARELHVAARPVVSGPPENRPPTAVINYAPREPHVGEGILLAASGADPEGGALRYEWDLNGDGAFGDATDPSTSTTFQTPGPHVVAVRVTDAGGAVVTAFETITVLPSVLSGPALEWLSPFPVVRIAGTAGSKFTRVRLLSVLAPAGTRVLGRCEGRGCPRRAVRRHVHAPARSTVLRIHAFERRLRNGTRIEVSVTKDKTVGKFTRLVLRALKPPARKDECIVPGRPKPTRCPRKP